MKNIEMQIRKYELIVFRLKNIKEMELILVGNSKRYKKYMNDEVFIEGVKHRLEIEKELLEDLKNNKIYEGE